MVTYELSRLSSRHSSAFLPIGPPKQKVKCKDQIEFEIVTCHLILFPLREGQVENLLEVLGLNLSIRVLLCQLSEVPGQ